MKRQHLKIMGIGLITSAVIYWFGVLVCVLLPSSRFLEHWGSFEWMSFMWLFVPLTILPCSVIGNILSDDERSIRQTRRFYYLLTLGFNCFLYWLTYQHRDLSDFYVRAEMGLLFQFALVSVFLPVFLMMVILTNLNRKFLFTFKTKAPLKSMLTTKNVLLCMIIVLYYVVVLLYLSNW